MQDTSEFCYCSQPKITTCKLLSLAQTPANGLLVAVQSVRHNNQTAAHDQYFAERLYHHLLYCDKQVTQQEPRCPETYLLQWPFALDGRRLPMAHERTCTSPAGHVAAEGGRPGASQSRIENCLPTSSCVANLRFAWSKKGLLSPPATLKVESLSTKAGRRGTRLVACCCYMDV